jgi:predicted nucleic acid-binding protein
MLVVLDTEPLYAALDRDDDHEACAELLQRQDLRPVIPALVVA